MSFCYKCGTKLGEKDVFCTNCGTNNRNSFVPHSLEKEETTTSELNESIIYIDKSNLARETEAVRGKLVINSNRVIIAVILIVVCTGSFFGIHSFYANYNYKKYLNEANSYMNTEQYDNAVTSYEEALKYKNDSSINKQIEHAKILKYSKEMYETAIKKMNAKQYVEAMDTFKKVDKQDTKRYSKVESMISDCKNDYAISKLNSLSDSEIKDLIYKGDDSISRILQSRDYAIKRKDNIYYSLLGEEFNSREKLINYLRGFFADYIINTFEIKAQIGYIDGKYTASIGQIGEYSLKINNVVKKEFKNSKMYITVNQNISDFDTSSQNVLYVLKYDDSKLLFTYFDSSIGELGSISDNEVDKFVLPEKSSAINNLSKDIVGLLLNQIVTEKTLRFQN